MAIVNRYIIDPERIAWRVVDGEAVILNLGTGSYYSLDKIGTRMWQLISEKRACEEAIGLIVSEYEAEKETIADDFLELISELKKEGLIDEER